MRWKGADRGRESLLPIGPWLDVLAILAQHEGEDLRDPDSPVYTELAFKLPDVSWTGAEHDRPFFRDYPQAWTTPGVLMGNTKTGGVLTLTPAGRSLVKDPSLATEFFRSFLDTYIESFDIDDLEFSISPYELIAAACLEENPLGTSELQATVEDLASSRMGLEEGSYFNVNDDVNRRRFLSYLVLLENALAIRRSGTSIEVLDPDYLRSMVQSEDLAESISGETTLKDSIADTRRYEDRKVVVRERQRSFSSALKIAYSGACCISRASEEAVLEGAHITPYLGRESSTVQNGLLLAVDIHRLFDRQLIGIDPSTLKVHVAPVVTDQRYRALDGTTMFLPEHDSDCPNPVALQRRFDEYRRAWQVD